MNGYDFAIDIEKIDNIIADLEAEKTNMENAITNMYDIIYKMNENWEGKTYDKAKATLEGYKEGLEASVTMVKKMINIIKSNKANAETIVRKIQAINDNRE